MINMLFFPPPPVGDATPAQRATPVGATPTRDHLYRSFTKPTEEQLATSQKTNLDTFFGLSGCMVEGVGKLAELNMQATRATLAETLDLAQKAPSVKETEQWLALQNSLAALAAEKIQAWSRQAFDIVAATQADLVRCAHAQWEAQVRQARTQVEGLAKSAPAGSEAAVAALDQAITAANALYETLEQAGRQAVRPPEATSIWPPRQPGRALGAESIQYRGQQSDND